ncbi:MAG: DUF3488 and transglutaminase-like domain-containing protein [Pyrinomonadaceae bacterium]|nr:DUF3488 and transglutaminase-like domain-containing protein [Pyrinomonadaceae bacterium]
MFKSKNFEFYFRLLSYLTVLGGFIPLWISGTFGILGTALFIALFIGAWFLEDTKWQISERIGTFLIVLALPLFYFGWKFRIFGFSGTDAMLAGILARLILSLTAIKLLQKKSDRDWIFLYMMSFFEVLLAAGLSISALYLATFVFYLLLIVSTIIAFEIRKTFRKVNDKSKPETHRVLLNQHEKTIQKPIRTLPLTAIGLIIFILILATPIFFLLPRVSGAGFGSNFDTVSTSTGFSDSVNLGSIGKIQQNDQVVMRVRLEQNPNLTFIRWRGVALDYFDNKNWRRTVNSKEVIGKDERGFFRIPPVNGRSIFAIQTIYLEPLDRPNLFTLPRPVAVQGNFSDILRDSESGLSFNQRGAERISYKVWSDVSLPDLQKLRADNNPYSADYKRYLELPKIDARIPQLAENITSKYNNRYDKAKAVEEYLQTQFGYTLDLKAGGDEPLADFLFNVREGHCEYFATAMAIMLRTQGIATRIVNGFQQGEFNATADIYVVKQRNAHSWVEVYFPSENIWVPFDPTPFAGQNLESNASTGMLGQFNNYMEALETFWVEYFVSYDNQGQRSLMNSVKNGFVEYQAKTSDWFSEKQEQFAEWWKEVRGEKGFESSLWAIGYGIGYFIAFVLGIILLIWLYRKLAGMKIFGRIWAWLKRKNDVTIVEFYERMQKVLARKGFKREPHQTPLEFAFAVNMPEAVKITEKYNRVRFGEKDITQIEAQEIEDWLKNLESKEK